MIDISFIVIPASEYTMLSYAGMVSYVYILITTPLKLAVKSDRTSFSQTSYMLVYP